MTKTSPTVRKRAITRAANAITLKALIAELDTFDVTVQTVRSLEHGVPGVLRIECEGYHTEVVSPGEAILVLRGMLMMVES